MLNMFEVIETNNMIEHEKLDVRTITMGISLLDCCDSDLETLNQKIYNKIISKAKNLVSTGEEISRDFGIPIVNKRVCDHRKNLRPGGKGDWRQFYRRLFCVSQQRHDTGGGESDPVHSESPGRDGAGVQFH